MDLPLQLRSRVQSSVLVRSISTKELFQIVPMHTMNREIIPVRKRGFDSADNLSSSVKVVT